MSVSEIDFGEDAIPLTGTDAFFLDTNIIVSYLYEKDEKHLPCYGIISYLLKNDVILCISEVVIVELMNTLARTLYIDDNYNDYIQTNGELDKKKDQRNIHHKFRRWWSEKVIKNQPETLLHYNNLASDMIKEFIPATLLIECSDQIIEDTLEFITTTQIASADAIIISTALNFGCQYILSNDKDMNVLDGKGVIHTDCKNDNYNVPEMFTKLDISDYLREELGEVQFSTKFPNLDFSMLAYQGAADDAPIPSKANDRYSPINAS